MHSFQLYGSGKELCNTMWGPSFRYTDPKCPCSKMSEPIPADVNEESVCSGGSRITFIPTFSLLILIGHQAFNFELLSDFTFGAK